MAAQIGASAAAARAHEELYAYWAGLRHGPKLPGRCDIRPEELKRLLPTVSLIDVRRDPLDFRIRLAGTGLYGVYGREIFETWYKMIAMLTNGLDIRKVITHRFKVDEFKDGFAAMKSGLSGKVVLDWR